MAVLLALLVLLPVVPVSAGSGRAEERYVALIKQLSSPKKRERADAANKLADWEGRKEQSVGKITDALIRERDKYTAKQMVKALARIGSPRAFAGLLDAMKVQRHEDVRIEIVKRTGLSVAKGAPREVSGIWDRAVKDPSYKVQETALGVLSKKKWSVASPHVHKAAASSRFAVIRARAVTMIGLSKELSLKAFIRIFWRDPSPQVKKAVLDIVAVKTTKEAIDLLKEALEEKHRNVREHALKKIRRLYARADKGPSIPGSASMQDALLRMAKREKDAKVMALLINVLAEFPMGKASEKVFIASLRHRSPLVRIAACRALSKSKSQEAARALGARRPDPMPSVRQAAVNALVKIRTSRAVEALVPFIVDRNKDVYKAALDGLAEIGDRRTVAAITLSLKGRLKDMLRVLRTLQALRRIGGRLAARVAAEPALLGHKDKMIRFEAARTLAEHPWAKAVSALIDRVGEEKDSRVRVQLIRALGQFKTPRVMAAVSVGLNAREASVIKETIIALRGATNRNLVDDLDQVFNRKTTRLEMVKTLASIGGPKAAARLLKLFDDRSSKVRYTAIEGMGSCGLTGEERDKYVEVMIGLFEKRKTRAREVLATTVALDYLGGERAQRFLLNQAKSKRAATNVRGAAMAALVRAKHPEAYKVAAKFAMDNNSFLRRAGYKALGILGEEKGVKKLLRALKKTTGTEQVVVIEALAKNGRAAGVLDKLKKALKREEKAARSEVVLRVALMGALARIDQSDEMAKRFTELLDDEEFQVQQAACRALATFKYKPSIEKLMVMMKGDNKVLRAEAVKALEMITNLTYGRFADGWANWWAKNRDIAMDRIVVHGFARHSPLYTIKGDLTDAANAKALIKALSDYESCCRYNAARALRAIAGKNLGYDSESAHDAVGLAAWKKWNAENNG